MHESFSWVAMSWRMLKATIDNIDIVSAGENEEYAAYIKRCVNRFNEDTAHLGTIAIKDDFEAEECVSILSELNAMECARDYLEHIGKMLSNLHAYLNGKAVQESKPQLRLVG